MLIIALVLAVIGLAALVTAVVTGNAVIAWVCIAASVAGVVLLIVDAVRERTRKPAAKESAALGSADPSTPDDFDVDYPGEDYPDESEYYGADDTHVHTDEDSDRDADADTRAVWFHERHEQEINAEHPEGPTTR